MKSIFVCLLHLGSLWENGSNHAQYRWFENPRGLDPKIGVLLRQGLKIGYLPESNVNGE